MHLDGLSCLHRTAGSDFSQIDFGRCNAMAIKEFIDRWRVSHITSSQKNFRPSRQLLDWQNLVPFQQATTILSRFYANSIPRVARSPRAMPTVMQVNL
ncbi:MAG: hypothetical protein JWP89_1631 [Schlesneria sp.]|nr:hypothetical protein [Schlesneria sp.]